MPVRSLAVGTPTKAVKNRQVVRGGRGRAAGRTSGAPAEAGRTNAALQRSVTSSEIACKSSIIR